MHMYLLRVEWMEGGLICTWISTEEPIQENGAIRDFHVQEELLSCLLLSEEPVLFCDFLRD